MSAPYIPLYIDDYDAATAHLTPEEDGIYGRLLRLCWRTPGCSIPNEPEWIARKIRLSMTDYERIAAPVIAEFFTPVRGRLTQRRLKREFDDISRKKNARKLAGKKGGISKALKEQEKSASNATVLPADTRAFPEPEPYPDKETPIAPKGAKAIRLRKAHVEQAWEITPPTARTRTSRADIEDALKAAAGRGHEPEAVIAGLAAYYRTPEATRDGGQFAKGAHRIIAKDRWQDFEGPTPLEALAAAPDPLETQRRRVQRYLTGSRYWNTIDWGPEPGRPGCTVPASVLAEFAIPQPQEVAA